VSAQYGAPSETITNAALPVNWPLGFSTYGLEFDILQWVPLKRVPACDARHNALSLVT
jgi:hypothetical protein